MKILATVALVLAVLSALAPAVVLADCEGEECLTCKAYVCMPVIWSGYCVCEMGVDPRYCVAGGGICIIYWQRIRL